MKQDRANRKIREGIVISNKMDQTVVVRVDRTIQHHKYGKVLQRGKRYYAHDQDNKCVEGQKVTIYECRPLSKTKRWRVATEEQTQ